MKYKILSIVLGVALVGASVFFFFMYSSLKDASSKKVGEESSRVIDMSSYENNYGLINKTVVYDLGKHYIIDFSELRETLFALQKKYDFKTYIYFNYLNNGSWIGFNERDYFPAASLVKVPLAMSVMKSIEENRLSLDQSYTLEDLDLDSNFGDLYERGSGWKFSVKDLMGIMLQQSDNTARSALFNVLSRIGINDPLYEVYSALGWDYIATIEPGENEYKTPDPNLYADINLKLLSNMFIALYNSSYLNLDNSQQLLKYLALTPFNDKIRAGVPEDVIVSHKIGIASDKGTFSDCGIVYAPNRNYLLCLGASGGSEVEADKFMSEVSKEIYDYVIKN